MKRIFTILATVLLTVSVFAQSPEKISYQAVVRDASNNLVTSTPVGMQISIFQGSASGTLVYEETQTPTTNANGLVTIEIGSGIGFDTITWANGTYFIKTETDPTGGTTYSIAGTSQLLSVPYALHAKTAENVIEVDPVFGASIANGITGSDTTNWNNKLDIEVDGDTLNELQSLSISGNSLSISDGNTVSLPSTPWLINGSDIYYNTGLIGIGVSSPSASLDIYDNIGYQFLKFESTDNVYTTWISNRIGADDYQIGIDGGNNKFAFANLTTGNYPFVIHGQNVGLGTLNPEAPLHINDFMKLEPRNSPPSSPTKGMIYYDSNDDKVKAYTGSVWENLN